jgi:uncharacterized protein YjbI with pentapeptide repeats
MAYTMIAERNNQTVRKQRESALIVLANARVMQSEGWQVVILDDDGTDFDPRAFEASLANKFSWYEVKPEPVVRETAAEPIDEPLEAETLVAAALEAEDLEAEDLEAKDLEAEDLDAEESDAEELEGAELALRDIDEADFDEPDAEAADLEEAELEELDEMEFEGEPAE